LSCECSYHKRFHAVKNKTSACRVSLEDISCSHLATYVITRLDTIVKIGSIRAKVQIYHSAQVGLGWEYNRGGNGPIGSSIPARFAKVGVQFDF